MAEIKKETGPKNPQFIIHEMNFVSVDRSMKDIRTARTALRNAEQIVFPNRTRLYDLYADVELDGHLTGLISKRIGAVLNKEIEFIKDGQKVDAMECFIKSEVFYEIMREFMMVKFYGVSGLEFTPGKEVNFKVIPRKHIRPESKELVLDQSSYDGTPYENISNIYVIGKERDFGLLLQCSFYAIYKKGDFADWAQYVEIFGQPMRVFKYDANDLKTKEQLTVAANESGGSLALVIPKQAEIEVMDGKSSNGNGELQEKLKNACNDEMSVIILGNTETTSNSNGGSNAKAQEHGKQQMEITKSDMRFMLGKLNSNKFLNILSSYGLPVEGGEFRFEQEMDLTALTQKILIDQAVAKQVPIDDDYFYDHYKIPKPADYEARKKQMQQQQESGGAQPPENAPESGNPVDRSSGNNNNNQKEKPKKEGFKAAIKTLLSFFDQAR